MSLALYAAPFGDNDSDPLNSMNTFHHLNKKKQQKIKETFQNAAATNSSFDSEKVSKFLQHLHKKTGDDDEDDDNEDNDENDANNVESFNQRNPEMAKESKPITTTTTTKTRTREYFEQVPPLPQSAGIERRQFDSKPKQKQNPEKKTKKNVEAFTFMGKPPSTLDELSNYESNYLDENTAETYYKQHLPEYTALKRRNFYNNKNNTHPYYNLNANANTNTNANAVMFENEDNIILKKLNYMVELLEDQKDEKTNNVMEEVVLFCFLGIFLIFLVDSFVRVGKYVR
jgi:hypothetical protein